MGGGSKGDRLHWRVQGSTSSPTGIGSRRRSTKALRTGISVVSQLALFDLIQ